ncbi:hypothetical protein [Zarconia navalis]|uniref:hypothetical protein n=1 Tax=Zarconia navalis TaxID=2992134 RepID=UPI0021F850BB|nr:hypothetical protein [Zarconia navalis]
MSTPEKQYRSDVFAAIHETMEALHDIDAINTTTMRQFDETCLEPVRELTGDDIRTLQEPENVSQPVFVDRLNVSQTLVSDRESDVKKLEGWLCAF